MRIARTLPIVLFALLCINISCQECDISSCVTCLNTTHCEECEDNYALDSDNNQCIPTCQNNIQLQSCLCEPNEVNQNGICTLCQVDDCILCSYNDANICDFCIDGYQLADGFCVKKCSGQLNVCQCSPYEIKVGSNCLQCSVTDCTLCAYDDSSSCDICAAGKIKVEGADGKHTCEDCQANYCQTCSSTNSQQCQICFQGFTLNDQTKTCQQAISCTRPQFYDGQQCICESGYFGQNCSPCPDRCASCQMDGCSQCDARYFLDGNGECSACSSNCLQCVSNAQCLRCQAGYTVALNGGCRSIQKGISGSVLVSTTDQNGNTQNIAIVCQGSCLVCSQSKICQVCKNGFYNDKGKCKKCQRQNCKTCSSGNPTQCQSCYSKRQLINGQCLKCPQNCLTCVNDDYCSVCQRGFFVDQTGKCSPCVENCQVCFDSTGCQQCGPGYTSINNQCVECLQGCSFCDQFLVCQGCNEGLFLNSDDQCQICPVGCYQCLSLTQCSTCVSGYQLQQDNLCYLICDAPCYTCVSGQPTACLSCYAGYIYNQASNTCIEDTTCNQNQDCIACPLLSFLIDQRTCPSCNLSDQNCQLCEQDLTTCSLCKTGYYMDADNICQQCLVQCSDCDQADICTQCKFGYFMLLQKRQPTGICMICSAEHFCQTCLEAADQCHSCIEGYILVGHKCYSFYQIVFTLVLDGQLNSQFMNNYVGFKRGVLQSIGGEYSGKLNLITGRVLQQGSVNYQFILSVFQNATRFETLDLVRNQIFKEGNTINGIQILSAEVDPNYDRDQPDEEDGQTTDNEQDTSLGLILGLSIPLALIALVILFVIMRRSPKNDEFEDDYGVSGGKLTGLSQI